ncbi:MAG: glycerol-3-phosphate 1-O-acyltransferase PlsY [Clostridia bacterium]|nr:glycerol-3-phosphate 1-O-acyltransferase PlsY [Clostridia bacterium]
MKEILVLLLIYFIGAVPMAYLVGKYVKGMDIRKYGSGNVGATNAFRIFGTGPGLAVLMLDLLKGVAAVLIARYVGGPWFIVLASFTVMAGHNYSIFLGFKGGRGVATGAGIILSISPLILLIALIIFVIIVVVTKYVSLGSIIAAFSIPLLMLGFKQPAPELVLGLVAAIFVIYRHKPNIERLLNGTEPKITER